MILNPGSKVLIVHRRLFENDSARFFTGTVDGYEAGVAKVRGHTWLREGFGGTFHRKPDLRTKIVALGSGTLIVYELPVDTEMTALRFELEKDGRLCLRDGRRLDIDLSEVDHPHKINPYPGAL